MNKVKIKKLGVFSVAKIQAIVMGGVSLLVAVPVGLIMIAMGLTGAGFGGNNALAGGGMLAGVGIFYIIGIPIIYAIVGFIGGAIGALIYNVCSGVIGGIEMELETVV